MADLFGIHHDDPEADLRTALEAIQELHGRDTWDSCLHCNASDGWSVKFPCPTRRLADQGLGGGNNG